MEEGIHKFGEWFRRYPRQYLIYSNKSKVFLDSIFLSMFVAFRRIIYQMKLRKIDIVVPYYQKIININEFGFSFNLEDLKNIYLILHRKPVPKLNLDKCDQIV